MGAQWDLAPSVTLGLIFRPPGIELWNTSLVTSESSNLGASTGSLTILQTEISLQSISVFYAISYEF